VTMTVSVSAGLIIQRFGTPEEKQLLSAHHRQRQGDRRQ